MKTDLFDYPFSRNLIAQEPMPRRDESRLMLVERTPGRITHHVFTDLPKLLDSGDCLVLNNSRVMPARLEAKKEPTGGSVEILLLDELCPGDWSVLSKGARVRPGTKLSFSGSGITAEVMSDPSEGRSILRFHLPESTDDELRSELFKTGRVPLPPYITNDKVDGTRYQTIYSRREISAAAPTAGLHFTDNIFSSLEEVGVNTAVLELAVGIDTFIPIREEEIEDHKIHREWFSIDDKCAEAVNNAGRVVAVGTTSVRALESAAGPDGTIRPVTGSTELYITPDYRFRVVQAMLTNFHFPRSTLLVLVSAFAGRDLVLEAYNEAIREGYRFYSFGDAMLVV